ncbi:Tyrosine--tRNA ligase [Frankliniella fusca]|uniref:Tyrosine--tRNA ligase n=1 Tax=Frankliniella fusca TaxID=407009 RepID=A0AAE1LGM8_9NEOP|nr:Tyrosine--tRNA ligase [Frankliniella fusca]
MSEVRFTKTQRGKDKLVLHGYMYVHHRDLKSGESEWRCDKRRSDKCNATVTLAEDRRTVVKEREHPNHQADWGRVKAKETVEQMRDDAQGSRETTASIVQRHVAGTSREAAVKLPNKASLARAVRRVKRSSLPEDPKDIEDLVVIAEQYQKLDGQRWLLFFDPDAEDKMIVLATNRHLRYLAKAKYWIMDGTFKSAPGVFYQLYTLHGQVHGQWFPLVMVLMVKKSKDMYIELFELLKHEVSTRLHKRLDPEYVLTDYEEGAIRAILHVFPDVQIAGCLFHLGQSFWRKLQDAGLAVEYREEDNEDMRTSFHSLIAVAFCHLEDVKAVFDELRRDSPAALRPVFKHVDEVYIRGCRRGQGRRTPVFPPEWWNCHARALGDLPRTTNSVEAWHRRLNTIMGKSHPTLYFALDQLQMEAMEMERDIERLSSGRSPEKKKKNQYVIMDQRISRIMARYEEYKEEDNMVEFLRAIGHNIAGNL